MAGLVDAFDTENAGNFFDICKDGFELALIGDFKVGVDARVGAVGAAFQVVNVGAGAADNGGDVRQKARAIARANGELNGESSFGAAAPLDGDAPLGLIHQVLNVGARPRMDGDAAAARDVADNFVPGNGIATFGAVDEQVVVALDNQRSFAEAQNALDGLDECRFGVCGFTLRGFCRLSKKSRRDL